MSAPVTVKFEGGRELDAALKSLADDFDASKTTVKNVIRRGLKEALVPMADAAEANAPVLTGHLRDSITEGTKLTSRQARLAKREPKDFVTVYMGPNDPAAVPQEFGTVDQPAQPFMRPAFAAEAQATIGRVGTAIRAQLDKAVARAQRKAMKRAV